MDKRQMILCNASVAEVPKEVSKSPSQAKDLKKLPVMGFLLRILRPFTVTGAFEAID